VLIPLRFLALVGHFLAALIFFYGRVAHTLEPACASTGSRPARPRPLAPHAAARQRHGRAPFRVLRFRLRIRRQLVRVAHLPRARPPTAPTHPPAAAGRSRRACSSLPALRLTPLASLAGSRRSRPASCCFVRRASPVLADRMRSALISACARRHRLPCRGRADALAAGHLEDALRLHLAHLRCLQARLAHPHPAHPSAAPVGQPLIPLCAARSALPAICEVYAITEVLVFSKRKW
jgi:hypothetical protein